jgi:REP element-mobilizing transposase RayT
MPYWELYYHMVWATYHREPLITPALEIAVYHYIRFKCHKLKAYLHAVNGIEDHIHIIASIPPSCSISTFIGNLKGASSHFITREYQHEFKWQAGYGVFSLSQRTLDDAIGYVEKQKVHHSNGTTIARLEDISDDDKHPFD